MKILESIAAVRQARKALIEPVGFVPTMGYLHEGHLSLVKAARAECQHVFVSIFVNPAQFAPSEDLSRYPRDFERDYRMLEAAGVDYLFFPQEVEIYPPGYQTYVNVESLSRPLCGQSRPDHFRGVATVVLKLFNIVSPQRAYFGQKDAQQCALIKRMVKDLDLDLLIRVMPIVRDQDGLALSSRNQYLSEKERREALILPRSLKEIAAAMAAGTLNSYAQVLEYFRQKVMTGADIELDYIDTVDEETLQRLASWPHGKGNILVAAAIRAGKTRLIDNVIVALDVKLCSDCDIIEASTL